MSMGVYSKFVFARPKKVNLPSEPGEEGKEGDGVEEGEVYMYLTPP